MEINDMLCKHIYNVQAKISEKQEEIVMQKIQEIGGETFYEITIDKDKVLEALKMYKNKADYVEVKYGKWIVPSDEIKIFYDRYVICSECNIMIPTVKELYAYYYCPNCGAKMKGVKK